MTNNDKKPWDAAVESVKGTVDGAVKTVHDAVDGNVQQFKDLAKGQVEHAQELTGTARVAIKRVGKEAAEGLKGVVRPVVQVFEQADGTEGTELRKQLAHARETVNHQLYDAQLKLKETTKIADEQLVPVKSALASAQIQFNKLNTFRREHPEAALAGLVAIVGAPSLLLGGKVSAARNVLLAVGAGAGVAYATDKLDEKSKK